MLYDVLDYWKENIVVRIIVTVMLWALAALAAWYFDFWGQMAGQWNMPWLVWVTLAGFIVAGISLILTPLLEQFT